MPELHIPVLYEQEIVGYRLHTSPKPDFLADPNRDRCPWPLIEYLPVKEIQMESNLPPGESGNSLAVAGPDEQETYDWCDYCHAQTDQIIFSHSQMQTIMICDVCDTETKVYPLDYDKYDPPDYDPLD